MVSIAISDENTIDCRSVSEHYCFINVLGGIALKWKSCTSVSLATWSEGNRAGPSAKGLCGVLSEGDFRSRTRYLLWDVSKRADQISCSKPSEQDVFLFHFLLSEPFLRELISRTIKLHLLANSYNFFHDCVLVPPNFSIPPPVLLWQVAQLQLT